MAHHPFYLLAFVPLVYFRIRRSIGYRKFGGRRLYIPIGIFLFILSLVVLATAHHPMGLLADCLGGSLGATLGYLAIRETQFEKRPDGLYYRTHIWIQATVLALFLLRMGYRMYGMVEGNGILDASAMGPMQSFQDPWTAGVLCMLIIFNLAYFSFVLRQGLRMATLPEGEPALNPVT